MSTTLKPAKKPVSRPKRTDLPQQLPGATRFSDDRAEAHPLWMVKLLKDHPQFWQPLQDATESDQQYGRKRIPGHWALVYMAFVVSRQIDVEPWWRSAGHSIWHEAGFRERPGLRMTQRRFCELEQYEDEFQMVVNSLVRHSVKASGGQVGRDLHIDSTEAETHARLQHICPHGSPCYAHRAARVSATLTSDEAREHRHSETETPDDELKKFTAGEVDAVEFSDPSQQESPLGRRVKKVQIRGCWYRCLDPDAGIRAYTRDGKTKRFWVGYYNGKAIDHYTGAPVAVLVHSASINESVAYPELYMRAYDAIGQHPRAVVADRGYSLASVFKHNTMRGVATVAQWRRQHASIKDRSQEDAERWDRHGVVRCRHCGGPTRMIRFSKEGPGPRLWVQCNEATLGSKCEKAQTIMCSENWRMLVPLWRTSEAYQALQASGKAYERVHHHWRRRYRVGSDQHELRPKRRGRSCQQLRANAALIAEWVHIMWREGWLGSARRNTSEAFRDSGAQHAQRLARWRATAGLDKPYGKIAEELNLGPLRPASPFAQQTEPPPG